MNEYLEMSIEYANQRNYLDDLFGVYPIIPEGIRDVNTIKWNTVEKAFSEKDNSALIHALIDLDLFPVKDSYVAYLKRDNTAILRNPKTVDRICGRVYQMGIDKLFEKCSEPKETNRQIGPLFKRWIFKGVIGTKVYNLEQFLLSNDNAILDASDAEMKQFAKNYCGYNHHKGLDFVARFNNKYVLGEAKFLTDFGGHQNAQLNDALHTLSTPVKDCAEMIAILDGVCYIPNKQMYKVLTEGYGRFNIMSALVLREFLYQL